MSECLSNEPDPISETKLVLNDGGSEGTGALVPTNITERKKTPENMPNDERSDENIPEARRVLVMMDGSFRVSRNTRVQWFLESLGKTMLTSMHTTKLGEREPLKIIGFSSDCRMPQNEPGSNCTGSFKMVRNTAVTFLSRTYRLVFALDLSPSMFSVNLPAACVMIDLLQSALRDCLATLVEENSGSQSPLIFVTVFAHAPHLPVSSQPVLVKGFRLRAENINTLLEIIRSGLRPLISDIVAVLNADIAHHTPKSSTAPKQKPFRVMSMNLLNILRKGLLSVHFLPEHSSSHLFVLTDGILAFPDTKSLDDVMSQLRTSTVSVSFLLLSRRDSKALFGNPFGYLPNLALMHFIARSTCGTVAQYFYNQGERCSDEMEQLRQILLSWTFQESPCEIVKASRVFAGLGQHHKPMHLYHTIKEVSVAALLSVRLREGFSVKSIELLKGESQVEFILCFLWMPDISLEYHIAGQWPPFEVSRVQVSILLHAPYEFKFDLHSFDTNRRGKTVKPQNPRFAALDQFIKFLQSLDQTDDLLVHFEQFRSKPAHYTVPDTVRDGMPLFYLHPDDLDHPVLSSNDLAEHYEFADFWRPLCTMELHVWPKWLHVHKIILMLEHDKPLPEVVFNEKRATTVRSSLASNQLHDLLKGWTNIVLVDSHTYVKFLKGEEESSTTPRSFFIIRLQVKAPCVILRLGFLGGTSGTARMKIIGELDQLISSMVMPTKSSTANDILPAAPCCWRFTKPVENMLVHYKDVPGEVSIVPAPATADRSTQTPRNPTSIPHALCRFLHSKRFIWMPMRGCYSQLSYENVGLALTILIRKRLEEGFHFASTTGGIFNMVTEIPLKDPDYDVTKGESFPSTIVQYIVFPPRELKIVHHTRDKTSLEPAAKDPKYAAAVEIWMEPQYGVALPIRRLEYLEGLDYRDIVSRMHEVDQELMSAIFTFGTLRSICSADHKRKLWTPGQFCRKHEPKPGSSRCQTSEDLSSDVLRFPFNLPVLLSKCQRTLLKFSSYQRSQLASHFDSSIDLLLGFFLNELLQIHAREVQLSRKDCDAISELLKHNVVLEPTLNTAPTTPTRPVSFGWDCVDGGTGAAQGVNPVFTFDRTNSTMSSWRCFVHLLENGTLLVTLVPSCYNSLLEITDFLGLPELVRSFSNSRSDGDRPRSRLSSPPTSMIIPVYIFSTTMSSLESSLIFGSKTQSTMEHDFTDHTVGLFERSSKRLSESRGEDMGAHRGLARSSSLKERQNMKLLPLWGTFEDAYIKGFVQGVYRALHMSFEMDPWDIQLVTDGFSDETPIELDITDFIRAVCPEFAEASRRRRVSGPSSRSPSKKPIRSLTHPGLHKAIREGFHGIIGSCFKAITTKPDVFYFTPPFLCESPSPLSGRMSSDSDASIEFRSDSAPNSSGDLLKERVSSGQGFFEVDPDTVSIKSTGSVESLFGSSDDDDGSHDGLVDNISEDGEDLQNPLFVQFLCTIVHPRSNKILGSVTVKDIPTSLSTLALYLDAPSTNFDWGEVVIRFEILCLTLPEELFDIKFQSYARPARTISEGSGGKDPRESESFFAGLNESMEELQSEPDYFSHLPTEQARIMKSMFQNLNWHLRDEIAYTLSVGSQKPTLENLDFVVKHVESTPPESKPNCVARSIRLDFVFNEEQSFVLFKKLFEVMDIDNYRLRKEGSFYYLAGATDSPVLPRRRASTKRLVIHHKSRQRRSSPVSESSNHTRTRTGDATPPAGRRSSLPVFAINHEALGIVNPNNNEDIRLFKRMPSVRDMTPSLGEEEECIFEDPDHPEGAGDAKLHEADRETGSPSSEEERTMQKSELPGFWLIFRLSTSAAELFFHVHDIDVDGKLSSKHQHLLKDVQERIKAVLKVVNQEFLLKDLYEKQLCDNLLETETTEELWKVGPGNNEADGGLKAEDEEQNSMRYLAAATLYPPGFFSCDKFHEHEFLVHPRLKTNPSRGQVSRGIQALRGLLDKFAVRNRALMFVVQAAGQDARGRRLSGAGVEKPQPTGPIFYIRLTERTRRLTGQSQQPSVEDSAFMISSPRAIGQMGDMERSPQPMEIEVQRAVSFEDSVSFESHSFTRRYDTIQLSVHGICPVPLEISKDLMEALQNRLDDAVLESLHASLLRNPLMKLNVDDVRFIQPLRTYPTAVYSLDVPTEVRSVSEGLVAVYYYILQNLGTFLSSPKYGDADPDKHFYCLDRMSSTCFSDDDAVFLYNRPLESARRGIAFLCVGLRMAERVESQLTLDMSSLVSNVDRSIEVLDVDNGPICFEIWAKGDVDMQTLKKRLHVGATHALVDFWMEKLWIPDIRVMLSSPSAYSHFSTLTQFMKRGCELEAKSFFFSEGNAPNRRSINLIVDTIIRSLHSQGVFLDFYIVFQSSDGKQTETFIKLDEQTSAKEVLHHHIAKLKPGSDFRARIIVLYDANVDNSNRLRSVSVDGSAEERSGRQKTFRRFPSRCDRTGRSFIPRASLMLIDIADVNVQICTYNFSQDVITSFGAMISRLFEWHGERARFLNNILLQKCGVFLPHKCLDSREGQDLLNFKNFPKQVELMMEQDPPSKEKIKDAENPRHRPIAGLTRFNTVMEDSYAQRFFAENTGAKIEDPVEYHGRQFLEIRSRKRRLFDERYQLNKLYESWLQRDRRPVDERLIENLRRNARPTHLCASPLLFDPEWRKNLATRFPDRQLSVLSSLKPEDERHSLVGTRTRHASGVPVSHKDKDRHKSGPAPSTEAMKRQAAPSVDSQWHSQIRTVLMQYYVHYLQMQGFSVVLVRPSSPQKQSRRSPQTATMSASGTSSPIPSNAPPIPIVPRFTPNTTYLQRCVPGGMIFLELFYLEPFYFIRMYGVDRYKFSEDFTMVENDPEKALLSLQGEIDRLKVAIHMHSFLHDFHLRRISQFVSGDHRYFKPGYHIVSFLEDFANYYQKAPSYSKSSFQAGTLSIKCGSVAPVHIYKYIVQHCELYEMSSLPMKPEETDDLLPHEILPALSCIQLPAITNGTEYNWKCILWLDPHDVPPALPKRGTHELPLRYYIILTSVDEFLPTDFIEERFGSFKTLPPPKRPRILETKPVERVKAIERPIEAQQRNIAESPADKGDNMNPKASLVAAFPNFLYIGYFSRLEVQLSEIVESKRQILQGYISNIIRKATVEYVRDTLWMKLTSMPEEPVRRRTREESGMFAKSTVELSRPSPRLSAAEFEDLLSHICRTDMCQWDPTLISFLQGKREKLEGVLETLKVKYTDRHHWFVSQNGPRSQTVYSLVVFSPKVADYCFCVTLRTVDVVMEAFVLSRNPLDVAAMAHDDVFRFMFEDFINACCFHTWKRLLLG